MAMPEKSFGICEGSAGSLLIVVSCESLILQLLFKMPCMIINPRNNEVQMNMTMLFAAILGLAMFKVKGSGMIYLLFTAPNHLSNKSCTAIYNYPKCVEEYGLFYNSS